jgi:hypothetical protein
MHSVQKYCSLSVPIGCMTFLFPTKPYYLLGERQENIKQAKGNECSQYKSTAAWAFPLAAWRSYFEQNPTTYWVKERKIKTGKRKWMWSVQRYCSLGVPIGCMTFLFPTKPYYLLSKRAENLNRQKEMNVVSTKVLQPERSHWVHDIPISNNALLLTVSKSGKY